MAIPFTLISVGSVMIFLGLLNGDITVWHDIVKFGGCALLGVGLVSSAVVALCDAGVGAGLVMVTSRFCTALPRPSVAVILTA